MYFRYWKWIIWNPFNSNVIKVDLYTFNSGVLFQIPSFFLAKIELTLGYANEISMPEKWEMKCRGLAFVIKTSMKMVMIREYLKKTYRKSDITSCWTCCLSIDLVDFLRRNVWCTKCCWFIHRFNFLFEFVDWKIAMHSSGHFITPFNSFLSILHVFSHFSVLPPFYLFSFFSFSLLI